LENCLTHETYVDYIKKYTELCKQLGTVQGLNRYFLISQFNMSFLNPKFYSEHGKNIYSSIMYETNRPPLKGNKLLQSITEFFCISEFSSLTGLSLLDILDMDYSTYLCIKKTFENIEKPKSQYLTESLNSLQRSIKKSQ
jgi:hypothetical protein